MGTADADVTSYDAEKSKIHKFEPTIRQGNPKALDWDANHGDVIYMLGEGVQRIYKHAVEAQGFRFGTGSPNGRTKRNGGRRSGQE